MNGMDETRPDQDRATETDIVHNELVREAALAIRAGDNADIRKIIEPLHAADLADLIGLLAGPQRRALAELIKDDIDPEVLTELEGVALDDFLDVLKPHGVADAVSDMETDDAVEILEEMDEEERREVLKMVPADDRVAIEEGLTFPEDSAGRLMQRDLVAVPPYWTIEQTLAYMREQQDLPENFWEIFVVDPRHRPVGTMPLSWVLRADRDHKVEEIMMVEQTLIRADMDQEEVAYRFGQYNLVSAAVTDDTGRLVGVITVDDIVDVIEEEADEDILALGGVHEGDINVSIAEIAKTRFGWLFLNLLTAILASFVIGMFGATIERMVALAILMPIVASMGGNAGTQTMTVAVRALATRELTSANARRIVNKEAIVGLVMGVVLATITGLVATLWFDDRALGLVIGAAMIINLLVAGLAGILIPISLDRIGIDPAVASSVFVTTITDVVGFFAFLGLGAKFLM